MKVRKRAGAVLAAVLSSALMLSPSAVAAGPGGGGGGGHGGGQGGGGGGGEGDTTGSIYSDLVIALRAVDGTPILKRYDVPATEETEATTEYCVQPISRVAVPGLVSRTNPVDGATVWVLPLQGEWLTDPPATLPVEEIEPCDAQPQYAMFVTEVELERLNLARTSEDVLARKLSDVTTKLRFADVISLDGAGRLTFDGTPIDASPEHAAIYDSLMKTGTLPGLPTSMAGPPAQVSLFDAWMLAAAAVGTASGKEVPINVDTIEYYNRVIGFPTPADPTAEPPVPEYVSPWGVQFVRSEDPAQPGTELTAGDRFVDYSGFSYTRSDVFKGSVTWLDVPSLTWRVDRITDVVDFTNKDITTTRLTGVRAFAQLADDVRAVILYLHGHEVVPGFFMDPVGEDTTAQQQSSIVDPAVDVAGLPADAFRTLPFEMTTSLYNPWAGTRIEKGRLRLTFDAATALTPADLVMKDPDGQDVPLIADGQGNLVAWWGPETGSPVEPGSRASTTFGLTVAGTAPVGEYAVTLDLVDVDDVGTVLATDAGQTRVNDHVPTVLWGDSVSKMATQATAFAIPVTVYAPEGGPGQLVLTISGPGDDPATEEDESLAAADVKVYGSNGLDMVAMPLTLTAEHALVGTWDITLPAGGLQPVTWYATVATGAPVGNYTIGVTLQDHNTLDPAVVAVAAAESHGQKPPDTGEDAVPPVVTLESVGDLGSSATFTFSADSSGVTFQCRLTKDGVVTQDWATCTSPKTYTDLDAGTYVFSVQGKKGELVSTPVTRTWVVESQGDLTAPVVTLAATGTPGTSATFTLSADEEVTGYECSLTRNSQAGAWKSCTSPVRFSGLASGTYVLSVRATDAAGNTSTVVTTQWTATSQGGGGTVPGTIVSVPGAPTIGTATAGDGSATVRWTAPSDDGGDAVTGYEVAVISTSGATTAGAPASARSLAVSGLTNGVSYTFQVRAVNSQGPGAYSAASNAVIPTAVEPTPSPTRQRLHDFDGDGRPDLLARDSAGRLWLYRSNGKGGWKARTRAGVKWNGMTAVIGAGDVTGDGRADLWARDRQGRLWLYRGTGNGTFRARIQVGSRWNGMTALIGAGDLTGDKRGDLVARDRAGRLWLYPGNGKGGFTARRQIGKGWTTMSLLVAGGDVNGDSRPDLIARDRAGRLWLYPGNGKGGFTARRQLGKGWTSMTALVVPGDLTGDGRADLVARDSRGRLWVYPVTAKGTLGARTHAGSGWGGFTAII